ncbi:MAG: hypothetical protein AAB624_03815 [Patescibacteria group bacterium]
MTELLQLNQTEILAGSEISNERKKKLGEGVLGYFVERAYTLDDKVRAAKTLSTRRKEVSVLRNAGLEDAYEKRAAYTDKTKADLKFAKHGYSRRGKSAAIKAESIKIEKDLLEKRTMSGQIKTAPVVSEGKGILGRVGARVEQTNQNIINRRETKRVKRDSKVFAKIAIQNRERAANEKLPDFQLAHQEARARTQQTRAALVRSKLHIDGNRSNFLSSLRDGGQTSEDRLKGVSSRNRFDHEYMGKGMEYKARIANANEGMSAEAHQRRDEFNKEYDFNQLPIQGPSLPTQEEIEAIGPLHGPELPVLEASDSDDTVDRIAA